MPSSLNQISLLSQNGNYIVSHYNKRKDTENIRLKTIHLLRVTSTYLFQYCHILASHSLHASLCPAELDI